MGAEETDKEVMTVATMLRLWMTRGMIAMVYDEKQDDVELRDDTEQ